MTLVSRKSLLATCAALLFPLLLAACGGGDTSSTDMRSERLLSAGTTVVAADYWQPVQQLYVAYFGRPADAGGQANFEAQLAAAGAPTDIQKLTGAYDNNQAIRWSTPLRSAMNRRHSTAAIRAPL